MSEARRYQVLRVLGRGGFGTVYLANFQGEGDFHKTVAIKVLNSYTVHSAEVARRLRDEARILGLVRHRAIVAVDRLVQLHGRWTVVMEYLEGVTLSRLLALGALPLGPALEITAEVAGALHAAATRPGPAGAPLRLLHRDIKPSNIQVTPWGEVKVLDFGIARAEFHAREAETRSRFFGTPDYMPPERLYHQKEGPEGDVYSLGALLYEMLIGSPFGRALPVPGAQQEHVALARDRLVAQGLPEDVVALVVACLSWDPAARPSAGEVERRAIETRLRVGGEPLRYWAERALSAVPPSLSPPGDPDDENLCGRTLTESTLATSRVGGVVQQITGTLTRWPPTASTPVRRWGPLAALGVFLLGVVLVVPPGDPSPAVDLGAPGESIVESPTDPPPVVPELTQLPSPAPDPTPGPATTPPRSASPGVTKGAPSRKPEPDVSAPPAPTRLPATVKVDGLRTVTLESADHVRHTAPGAVAPGDYTVYAVFKEGQAEKPAMKTLLSLSAGETVHLSCDAPSQFCRRTP